MKRSSSFLLTMGMLAGLGGLMAAELPGGPFSVEASAARYYEVLGMDRERRDFDFDAFLFRTNRSGNLFFPKERPELSVQIQNLSEKQLQANGHWVLIRWGNQQYPASCWYSESTRLGNEMRIPVTVDLPPNGYADFTISPELPETFGGYALLLDLGETLGRRFVSSVARVVPNEPGKALLPLQAVDMMEPETMVRLGLNAVRFGIGFELEDTPQRKHAMTELDQMCRLMKEHNIVGVFEIGAGNTGLPLGAMRPHLTQADEMIPFGKGDYCWSTEYDGQFRQFVEDVVTRYGYPRGPIDAIKLWNEPWEGLSISGWGADMLRYRELYRIMGEATRKATAESGNQVLIGGCDSSSNTFDKLFPDGKETFTPYFDFCSIHYQGLSAPTLYRAWRERSGRKPVLIWDTESWTANADDSLATVIAANRAAGYDRSMGFYPGYAFGNYNNHDTIHNASAELFSADGKKRVKLPLIAYPMAASLAAAQYFIGDRKFDCLLFPEGLPWVFAFHGRDGKDEDETLVIGGDLGALFLDYNRYPGIRSKHEIQEKARYAAVLPELKPGTPEWKEALETLRKLQPFRPITDSNLIAEWENVLAQPWALEGVEFRFPAGDGSFALYDCYGNEILPQKGFYSHPLKNGAAFLRSHQAGGNREMREMAGRGQLYGMTPVEIRAYDFLTPIAPGAEMQVEIHNLLNRELKGNFTAELKGLSLKYPKDLLLKPFESRRVTLTVTEGNPDAGNLYPGIFRFDAGQDGVAEIADAMRVNLIARRTIHVDGDLSEWKGVLPQRVSASRAERSQMESAWMPFEELKNAADEGQAEVRIAADEQYFYFNCRVNDPVVFPGMIRMETMNPDEFFYPPTSYRLDFERTFSTVTKHEDPVVTELAGVEDPAGGRRLSAAIAPEVERMRFDLTLQKGRWTDVTLYFPYGDFRSGRNAQVRFFDQENGQEFAAQRVWQLRGGGFLRFRATGKVAVEIQNLHPWQDTSARLAGIFFDPAEDLLPAERNAARFLEIDEKNPGLWRGRFGKSGWVLVGEKRQELSQGIDVTQIHNRSLQPLHWPEGVSRFSYRKGPMLPDGADGSNVQIAFNSIASDQDPIMFDRLPGMPKGYINYRTSDREFALNPVAPEYGGGTEIWLLETPNAPRKHFYPRQPQAPWEGAVKDGKLSIRYENNIRIVEAAIPWDNMPEAKARLDAGKPLKFTFRINRAGGSPLEFGRGRSASFRGGMSFHPDWKPCYANEIEFALEPKEKK